MSRLWENLTWFPASRDAAGGASGNTPLEAWSPAQLSRGAGGTTLGVSARRGGTRATQLDAQDGSRGTPTSQGLNCQGDRKAWPGREKAVCEGFSELSP